MMVRDNEGLTDEVILLVPEKIFIPASDFKMGISSGSEVDGQPQHTVSINDYYIGRFEVINWQFAQFLTENPSDGTAYYSSKMSITNPESGVYLSLQGSENFPVRYVEWNAAQAFAEWNQGRLPFEVEWEKAARGGLFLDASNTNQNLLPSRQHPWGNGSINLNHANYLIVGRPFDGLAPVATYTGQTVNSVQTINNGSPYGAHDLLGNIAEWISDWYQADYYNSSPASNPSEPASGTLKVFRGGIVR